jgi:hypothetical protein
MTLTGVDVVALPALSVATAVIVRVPADNVVVLTVNGGWVPLTVSTNETPAAPSYVVVNVVTAPTPVANHAIGSWAADREVAVADIDFVAGIAVPIDKRRDEIAISRIFIVREASQFFYKSRLVCRRIAARRSGKNSRGESSPAISRSEQKGSWLVAWKNPDDL